jgi:hypothetical protein
MTDVTISALPIATGSLSTDVIPIVQGGITKQITNAALFSNITLIGADLGTPVAGNMANVSNLPLGSGVSGTLGAANGGTGLGTVPAYSIMSSGATVNGAFSPISSTTSGQILQSAGTTNYASFVTPSGTGSPVCATNPLFSGVIGFGAVAPTIVSATTIAPTTAVSFISGVVTIATITPPPAFAATGGILYFIPLAGFQLGLAGNIQIASLAVTGRVMMLVYDATTTKWYPSY